MYKVFAAIDVGSDDVSMKVYELTARKGYRKLDEVSFMVELGSDTYRTGKVSNESIEDLCEILLKFKKKMKEYGVEDYLAYASSAIREAENCENILNRISLKTGLDVQVLSNSEHRFIMYQGLVSYNQEKFDKLIAKSTAVVDIGAGSVQVSMLDNGKFGNTQNLKIGSTRVRDSLYKYRMESSTTNMPSVIEEYISSEIASFRLMYLKDKQIKNVIAIGDDISSVLKVVPELGIKDTINLEQFEYVYEKIKDKGPETLSEKYGLPYERASVLIPATIIYLKFLRESKAEIVWIPDVDFCDGIVTCYMDRDKKLKIKRNFNDDICSEALQMAKHYKCEKAHIMNVSKIALDIFDSTKSLHGLGERERLQLQIAAILHDCGSYINMKETATNSYMLIMATEIMGLSHKEREEVANIVKYKSLYLPAYKIVKSEFGDADYDKVARLAAILRIANAMDRSHKQKIEKFTVRVKDSNLIITADTIHDISLEAGLFASKARFFEQVYGIRPILKQKRSI